MKIKTERLIIRNFQYSDIYDFYEYSSHPLVGYTAGWKPHQSLRESERILVSKVMNNNEFAIILKETDKLIGSIELNKSHIRDNIIAYEIGFALNPLYWGMGVAYEATKEIMKYAFNYLHAEVLEMCHIVDNKRSENTIVSLGFIYDGIICAYKRMYDKRVVDVKLYHMTKDDYERMIKNERIKD